MLIWINTLYGVGSVAMTTKALSAFDISLRVISSSHRLNILCRFQYFLPLSVTTVSFFSVDALPCVCVLCLALVSCVFVKYLCIARSSIVCYQADIIGIQRLLTCRTDICIFCRYRLRLCCPAFCGGTNVLWFGEWTYFSVHNWTER